MTTRTVTYSEARNTLAACLREVIDDYVPIVIKQRNGRKNAVLISEEEYNSLKETDYLLSTPENTRRLMAALDDSREGRLSDFSTDDLRTLAQS